MLEKQLSDADAEELIKKYDSESNFRNLVGITGMLVVFVSVVLSGFHVYTAGFGLLNEILHRTTHMSFVLGLVFLVFPRKGNEEHTKTDHFIDWGYIAFYLYIGYNLTQTFSTQVSVISQIAFWLIIGFLCVASLPLKKLGGTGDKPSKIDYPLALVAVSTSLYLIFFFKDIFITRVGDPISTDLMMGVLSIIVVLEATRRTMGNSMAIIGIFSLLYVLFGPYMPGILAHRGYDMERLVSHMYLGTEGIFGIALGVVATYVFHFVLFGVLAQETGLGKLFIDVSNIVAGRYSGGAAKVSVVSSGLFGMISGSPIANTVTTGAFTIPMMKKKGFSPQFAAGVEASSSCGGQVTPPIMGASAFVMTEMLGIPYNEIILIAILPAAFHYLAALVMVHYEAKRCDIKGEDSSQFPSFANLMKTSWHLLIPIVVMVTLLLLQYSPFLAAFWGIILTIAVSYLPLLSRKISFIKLDESGVMTGKKIIHGFKSGAEHSLAITAACACVGFILGATTLTGLGFKFSGAVITVATDLGILFDSMDVMNWFTEKDLILFFALIMVAVACILMGAGIPTTPTYIILASIAAPALEELGIPLLVTHFFVFYYGVLADVTPPVALAAYAGAGISGSDPMKTGVTAFRLSMGKALVPFMFVYAPSLLFIDFTLQEFTLALFSGVLGIVSLGVAYIGYFKTGTTRLERYMLNLGGVILIWSSPIVVFIGTVLCGSALFMNTRRAKKING